MATRGVSNYSAAKIALTAGGIGLICGALVVAMMSGPSAIPSQVGQKPPAQTTGTATSVSTEVPAPGKNEIASVHDCDQQTWPYITQQCLTERLVEPTSVTMAPDFSAGAISCATAPDEPTGTETMTRPASFTA